MVLTHVDGRFAAVVRDEAAVHWVGVFDGAGDCCARTQAGPKVDHSTGLFLSQQRDECLCYRKGPNNICGEDLVVVFS